MPSISSTTTIDTNRKIPRRPLGGVGDDSNNRLAKEVSIVGLGCSSFSNFFEDSSRSTIDLHTLTKAHPVVQEWIKTIHYAILEAGINVLDTAPWYGHGSSEIVVGWALDELLSSSPSSQKELSQQQPIQRDDLVVNTKVGRYEADAQHQFDFSHSTTLRSVARSLHRLNCHYIDVLQLHDPEFAPSLTQLLDETIPAMLQARDKGYCKALGLTGYPLETQYQVFQATLDKFQTNIWDQALTYGHFNLHDSSLIHQPLFPTSTTTTKKQTYADVLKEHNTKLLAAAPLSMGLLTTNTLPEWHPASDQLKQACRKANEICTECSSGNNDKDDEGGVVHLSALAILYALSCPKIPCTLLGMKDIAQVKFATALAQRYDSIDNTVRFEEGGNSNEEDKETIERVLKAILSSKEHAALARILDPQTGPFGRHNNCWGWDGIGGAHEFWLNEVGKSVEHWQESEF